MKLKPFSEIKAPPSINLPALRPLDPSDSPDIVPLTSSSNGSSNGAKKDVVVTKKIKAGPDLPPGIDHILKILIKVQ